MRLGGERATPGSRVKPGDKIDLIKDRLPYSIEVLKIPSRRGPTAEARACYDEDDAVVREREVQSAALKRDRMLMPKTAGRPDKHTRRKLIDRNRG